MNGRLIKVFSQYVHDCDWSAQKRNPGQESKNSIFPTFQLKLNQTICKLGLIISKQVD